PGDDPGPEDRWAAAPGRADHRPAGQHLSGCHPDPGAEPDLHPQGRRSGGADRAARAVDARPARQLRPEPVHVDPPDDRLMSHATLANLVKSLGGTSEVTAFFLVL